MKNTEKNNLGKIAKTNYRLAKSTGSQWQVLIHKRFQAKREKLREPGGKMIKVSSQIQQSLLPCRRN